jgi:hypothetical protein
MVELHTSSKPGTVTTSRPWPTSDDGALLVAALVATLVEHRRNAGQRNRQARVERAGLNWRAMARLEQLRGQT